MNKEKAQEELRKRVTVRKQQQSVAEVIAEQASKLSRQYGEHTQLNKRVVTAIQKVLPKHTIYYQRDKVLDWVNIDVWGREIEYNDRIFFHLRLPIDTPEKSCLRSVEADEASTYHGLAHAAKNWAASSARAVKEYEKELENLDEIAKEHDELKAHKERFKKKWEPSYLLKDFLN